MADELIGKNIGAYEVLSRVGEGGMATVYLARQQSMNRQVALKVLPKHFIKDDTYMERFKREVDIVSKLEHRNIVPVYDYGEYEGQPYIAMRYMPAGSLDDILRDGPISNDKILSILSQISPALDYAHSKGVLHRDLKPSNVLMDDDGGAFITDFGIARVLNDNNPGLTTQGVVGTPSYMSPEQAQGKPLDGRSDIYSLGVMLFEMATGRRPFESETPYSIAVMQVTTQPPMPRTLNPTISTALEVVILKALKKSREERYHSASIMMESLKMAIERPMAVHDTEPRLKMTSYEKQVEEPKPQYAPQNQYMPPPSSASRPVVQPISLRSKIRERRKQNPLMSAFIGGSIGCGLLGIIVAASFLALNFLLPASATPTLSADSSEEAINVGTEVTRAPAETDEATVLDATSAAARETLLARSTQSSNASETPASQMTIRAESFSGIVSTIEGGTPELLSGLRDVSGTIVFSDQRGENNNFELITLDLDLWIETQLTQSPNANSSYPIPSPDGRTIAFQSNRDSQDDYDIFTVNRGGGDFQRVTFNDAWDRLAAWSPDGQWILYSTEVSDGVFDLRRVSVDGTSDELLYSNGGYNSHPRYSPDSRYLIFTSGANQDSGTTWDIVRLEVASNTLVNLTNNSVNDASPVFSYDGQWIIYSTYVEETRSDGLALMDINGSNRRILFDSTGNEWAASFSPDGRYIVFTSDITGTDQLYLLNLENGEVQQITTSGGSYATWLPPR
jgi:serine/threonine protein kinase